MDDAREWTATSRPGAPGGPVAVQPGDPWGAPAWVAESRLAGIPEATSAVPAEIAGRFVALIVDLLIVAILWTVGTQLASGFARRAPQLDLVAQAFGRTWRLVVPAAYFVLCHGTAGQTLGKRLLGVRVVDEGGEPIGYLRALGRFVAMVVAALPFGLGLVMAAFRRDRRGLHDLLAGTSVVRAR